MENTDSKLQINIQNNNTQEANSANGPPMQINQKQLVKTNIMGKRLQKQVLEANQQEGLIDIF